MKGRTRIIFVLIAGAAAWGVYSIASRDTPAPAPAGVRTIELKPQAPLQESMEDKLARLRKECAEEVRSSRPGQARVACEEYAKLHALHDPSELGPGQPAVRTAAPEIKQAPIPDEPEVAKIMVKYCDEFEFNGPRHRECKALERERLARRCRELQEQGKTASGEELKTILPYQRAYCREAERY